MGLFTVAVIAVVAEIVLRFVYTPLSTTAFRPFVNPEWKHDDFYEPDRDLFWRFKSSRTIHAEPVGQEGYEIHINNQGFRGENWPREIPSDATRILVVGDSCAFGWGAPMGESFPERLPQSISGAATPVDVMQAGVPGYTSFQTLRLFRKWAPEYRPHWVIVYVATNDTAPCVEKPDKEMAQTGPGLFEDSILAKSRLFALFRDFGFLIYKQLVLEKKDYDGAVDWESGPRRVSLEDFRENLATLAREAKGLSAKVVLLNQQRAVPDPMLEKYNQAVREVAEAEGASFVDVAGAFLARPSSEVFLAPEIDRVHPNPEGYALIARMTAEAMRNRKSE